MKEYPSSEELYRSWQELLETGDPFYLFVLLLLLTVVLILPLFYLWSAYRRYYPRSLKAKYRFYVGQTNYYQNLSPIDRLLFEKRVQVFINTKQFISRGKGFELNDEIMARVAASAVELSFGFPKMGFEHFNRILIYPDNYYSNITKKFHAGEVNARGFIVLSWKAFQEGYDDTRDGINLGIHEMAHALKLENRIKNGDYNFLDASLIRSLMREFELFKKSLVNSKSTILRTYAATNIHEFFAVLCENFFERPALLKEENSSLYQLMTQLLLQDPLETFAAAELNIAPEITFHSAGPIDRY